LTGPYKTFAVRSDFTGTGYELTVTKSDGTQVDVHLDSSFNVMMGGHGDHGGPDGPNRGTYGGELPEDWSAPGDAGVGRSSLNSVVPPQIDAFETTRLGVSAARYRQERDQGIPATTDSTLPSLHPMVRPA
jgi:hypothetical protein